jgi:DNA-directed RNA polymerase sigma subunit (sigma70/sigma32)
VHDGRPQSLEQVGCIFRVTRERIRQIENSTLKRLASLPEAQRLKASQVPHASQIPHSATRVCV